MREVRIGLLLTISIGVLSPAQTGPIFRGGVALVHVDVEVLGDKGRVLTGFSQRDFRVFEEDREQPIAIFSAGEQPLDLILLFDISGSMRRQVRKVAAVAGLGLQELRRGDRVSVISFNTEVQIVLPFSEDLARVEDAIDRVPNLRFGGGTLIQEAVFYAANRFIRFEDRNDRRRAVLIITDNLARPTRSKASVRELLWEADASLSGLVVRNQVALAGLLAPLGFTRPGGIEDAVENTGGDILRSEDLRFTFPEMMHRIRSRYGLYYSPPNGDVDSIRHIRVELTAAAREHFPEARVVARRGYRLRDNYGFSRR